MSKSHVFKDLNRRAQKEEQHTGVAFVRAEKAADSAITERLVEAYGPAAGPREDGRRRMAWRCSECGFANYESRTSCANCLAWQDGRGVDPVARAAANLAKPPDSTEDGLTLTRVNNRFYRSYCDHRATLRQATVVSRAQAQDAARAEQLQQPRGAGAPPPTKGVVEIDDDFEGDAADDGEEGVACANRMCRPGGGGSGGATAKAQLRLDTSTGHYTLDIPCPTRYHRFIVGPKGKTLRELERTFSVKLQFPAGGTAEEGRLLVEGPTVEAVRTAQLRVESLMSSAKEKVEFTHFLSIPLGPSARPLFASAFDDMRQTLVSEESGVDASVFQRPERVHITLLMLRLYNQGDIDMAKLVLESVEPMLQQFFRPTDAVSLRGLRTMTGEPQAAHVVYADVVRDEVHQRLQEVARRLHAAFADAGLASPPASDGAALTLHATVLNSKWRRGRAHQPFNATEALRLFGDRSFGTHRLRTIELNILSAGAELDDGYFLSETAIRFP